MARTTRRRPSRLRSTSRRRRRSITWATPADIVYGTALERDAAERDDHGAGHVRLHAAGHARSLAAGAAQTPVGDLHADRRRQLHDGDASRSRSTCSRRRRSITWAAPADIVYGTALSATPAERDDHACPARSSTRRRPRRSSSAGAAQSLLGDLHADRWRQLHDGEQVGRDQRHEGDPGRSPGRRPRTSSTAPRSARRS